MANQYNNLANKDKCYPNPVPACIGKENDSGLIRLADFFPDPDMSFWGICKFRSWFYFPSPGGNQQVVLVATFSELSK